MKITEYSLKAIEKEITTELKMRRKVWKRIPGMDDQFIDMDHQRRYNILVYLLVILENAPLENWVKLIVYAESAASVIQTCLEMDME
tara:strand:+ start:599 stop:859 length:261 start_codon:yes stop_codon:yes gene_type:complete